MNLDLPDLYEGIYSRDIGWDFQPKGTKVLKYCPEETQRLNKLINELLDLSQIESGQFPLNYTDFDINEQIRQLLITQEEKINAKEIDIRVDFQEDKCLVKADIDRIQQVIINLLDNAIKFNRHGGLLHIRTWKNRGKVL